MRVVITGATGFVGRALLARMVRTTGWDPHPVVRAAAAAPPGTRALVVPEGLAPTTDWRGVLAGADAVVHLAARVHVMRETAADPLAEFRRVNVAGTERLARDAVAAGVRRFVFVSSIKVNGEWTAQGRPFRAADAPAPRDAYGVSKAEAEAALWRIAAETGLEVVIVRPPLVYGPGVKANFRALLRLVARGVPLPLGAVRNLRSLVAVDNLADLLLTAVDHQAAAGRTFLASDDEDLSTPELLRRIGRALGRPARLVAVPPGLLRAAGGALGRGAQVQRLCASLQVDVTTTRAVLGWTPPLTVDEALAVTAGEFLAGQRRA